ncbi:MAG: AI-2E family transporter [Lachnospiraceae bacterium]|nr:AI-2E family transporter [Lachnospiraceae bacterium]
MEFAEKFRIWKIISALMILVLSVYFFLQFLLPLVTPFIICSILSLFGWNLFCIVKSITSNLEEVDKQLRGSCHGCIQFLQSRFGMDMAIQEQYLNEQMDRMFIYMKTELPTVFLKGVLGQIRNVAGALGFVFMVLVVVFLLAKDQKKIKAQLMQYPEIRKISFVTGNIFRYTLIYARAQLLIMSIISIVCMTGFWLLGMREQLTGGLLAGILDALPFIGTGIVLIPTGMYQLLHGETGRAIGCILIYGICVVVREFLEPKLIGQKMGIYPVVVLLSVYVGIQLFGISGMIKGPIGLMLIREGCHHILHKNENTRYNHGMEN